MSAKVVLGSAKPRLFTPELRPLDPTTTSGFAVIEFAKTVLHIDLLPWQEEFLIRGLELNVDGTFRFKTLLLFVSRQNGKTTIAIVLTLWWMYMQPGSLVLGTSVAQELAREPWGKVVEFAERFTWADSVKRGAIDTSLVLFNGSRYKVSTSGRRGGRSLSVDLLLIDELREHLDWDGWNALTATTTARPNPITLALSNAGDDRSVVLNALRASALSGEDDALGLFEWSAPEGCELDDEPATLQANPAIGHTITLQTLATKRNTLPPAGFRTEHLCQRVQTENPAVDKSAWSESADPVGTMDALKSRIVLGVDVSPDLAHVSLVAAGQLDDGRVRIETVAAWESTGDARAELPDLIARIKPKAVVWFPSGPAAAIGPDLKALKGSVELSGPEMTSACQSFAEFVEARGLLHSDDPMLTSQVLSASKTPTGDGWRFTRKGVGHCDGVYAAAGAVHYLRSKKVAVGRPRILMPTAS